MENFRILAVIGEGTYGKVFKAQHKTTGAVVAIKKFKQTEEEDPHVRKTMNREIRVLKDFKNANIVALTQVFRQDGKLFLVFDYVQETLLELLQKTPKGLPSDKIKAVIYQILKAVDFLHSSRVIHRDIKPENLLISNSGVVKLCDFGFARMLSEKNNYQYTDYVSTRWYRAPELLVGDAAYQTSVDVWAIGCIFAEIFNGLPLFPGQSDLHTLQLILETITADDIENDRSTQELTKKQRVAFRLNPLFEGQTVPTAAEAIIAPEHIKEVSFGALLKDIDEVALDFIRCCLVIDGSKRSTCKQLMGHSFFDPDFKASFFGEGDIPDGAVTKFSQMLAEDEKEAEEQSSQKLFTKDGKDEMDEVDLRSEIREDEEDEEDDDSGSERQFSGAEYPIHKSHVVGGISDDDDSQEDDGDDSGGLGQNKNVVETEQRKSILHTNEGTDDNSSVNKGAGGFNSGLPGTAEVQQQDRVMTPTSLMQGDNDQPDFLRTDEEKEASKAEQKSANEEHKRTNSSLKAKSQSSVQSALNDANNAAVSETAAVVKSGARSQTSNEIEEKINQPPSDIHDKDKDKDDDVHSDKQRSHSQHQLIMEGSIAEDVREDNVSSSQSVRKRRVVQMTTPDKSLQSPKTNSIMKTDLSYESPVKPRHPPAGREMPSDDYSDHQLIAITRQSGSTRDKVKSVMERPTENYIEVKSSGAEEGTRDSMFKTSKSSGKNQFSQQADSAKSKVSRVSNNGNSKNSGEQAAPGAVALANAQNSVDALGGRGTNDSSGLPGAGQFTSVGTISQVTPKIPQIAASKSPGNKFSTSFNTRKGPPNQNILQSSTLAQNGQMIMSTNSIAPKDFIDSSLPQQQKGHYFSRATPNKNNSLLPTKIKKANVTYSNAGDDVSLGDEDMQHSLKVVGEGSMTQSRTQTGRDQTPERSMQVPMPSMPAIQQISSNSQQANSIQVQKLRNQKKYLITPNVRGPPSQSTMHSQQHSLSDVKQHYESVGKVQTVMDQEVDGSYSTPAKPVMLPAAMKGKQPQSLTHTTSLENLARRGDDHGKISPRKLPVLKGQQFSQVSTQSQQHINQVQQFNKLKKSSIETSSNVINEQAPQQGIFFVNKIQSKNQNSVQHLPQPINLTQKRLPSQNGNKYGGGQQHPLKINDITPEKPDKSNQRGNYLVQGQPTTTNNVKISGGGPQVYYKVMHSTYQNYHRSSNSHLLASDLGISAKKLSPNQIMGAGSKKNGVVLNDEIAARQSNSQVNLLDSHTAGNIHTQKGINIIDGAEASTQGFASLSRTNNQGTMQQLVTFPKLMDAASHFKMQPGSKTQPKMSVPDSQNQTTALRNNSQMESQSQLLYGVTSSSITNINAGGTGSSLTTQSRPGNNQQSQNYLLNQTRSSSHVVTTTLGEGQTNFVSPQKFSTKKMPLPQNKGQYSIGVRQQSLNPSLQSTIRDENQYEHHGGGGSRPGANSQQRNIQPQKQLSQPNRPMPGSQGEYANSNSNKVLKNVTVHTAEANSMNGKNSNMHCFFVGSGAQAHLPNRSYNGSVLAQQSSTAQRLGTQLSGPQLTAGNNHLQGSPDPNNRMVQNLLKPTTTQQLSSSPIGTSITVGVGANTHSGQMSYAIEHDSAGAFPRRNLVTNKLKNQQVLQQRRRERADMHTSIFAVPTTSTTITSNAPMQGMNSQLAAHSSKADYTGSSIQPMFGGLQQNAKQGGSNLQLPSLKKLQPMVTESTMAHSSLSPSKSGGTSTQKTKNQPQVGGNGSQKGDRQSQYSFANKYGNEMNVKMSSKNIQHQQLMIRQTGAPIQHTRIPSSTLSKHTGQSRTSNMAMVVGSATNATNGQQNNQSNFAQSVPKQYRMYLGTSAMNNNSRASGDQSGISPRPNLPAKANNGLIIENSLHGQAKPSSQMTGAMQQPSLSQTNSSSHLRST